MILFFWLACSYPFNRIDNILIYVIPQEEFNQLTNKEGESTIHPDGKRIELQITIQFALKL